MTNITNLPCNDLLESNYRSYNNSTIDNNITDNNANIAYTTNIGDNIDNIDNIDNNDIQYNPSFIYPHCSIQTDSSFNNNTFDNNDFENNTVEAIIQRLKNNQTHKIFLNIADELAKFSKCASKQVGCVIVKNNRIISSGVNGSPSGYTNCNEIFETENMTCPEYREFHHKFSESIECHAEENAVITAAKYGISLKDSIFYVSMKPCERCLKLIVGLGVKVIYYRKEYDKCSEYNKFVQAMISELGIKLVKVE